MTTPYIGFGNEQLEKLPKAKEGMLIECKRCGRDHPLQCGTDAGRKSDLIMFYKCEGSLFLGAIAGKLVADVKPACSGEI